MYCMVYKCWAEYLVLVRKDFKTLDKTSSGSVKNIENFKFMNIDETLSLVDKKIGNIKGKLTDILFCRNLYCLQKLSFDDFH